MASYIDQLHRAKRLGRRIKRAAQNRTGLEKDIMYNVDNPRKSLHDSRRVVVDGWIVPKRPMSIAVRVRNNETIHEAKIGLRRPDVARIHTHISKEQAMRAGFSVEFEFDDGAIEVQVDLGNGYKTLYKVSVAYNTEKLPALIYNKNLTNLYPEHVNLLENRRTYYYEDELPATFERHPDDPRLVAMYLPQFHPFPENDKAWGKGFTEWTNVTSGTARFVGHQQPILPKDLGYYDLRLESKILEQINLAKKYGIHGFCFYYYWFSGKKLMEKPLESMLKHPEWDFNFTICWANENWTKRWDGRENDVIIAQEYNEDDPLKFIQDVEHILLDKRYITEDDKPVLMVYRASELKDPARYAEVWRAYFKEKHQKELQLVSFLSFDDQDPRKYGFDAALDFAPLSAFFKEKLFDAKQFPYIHVQQKLLDVNFDGVVADYRSIALNGKLQDTYDFPIYPCVTPSWDNEARKKGKGFTYQNSSPDLYGQWLRTVLAKQSSKSPLVFINAWNEWAEGAIMEPSMHMGHAVLNRTAEALASVSHNTANRDSFPMHSLHRQPETKLAVIVHLYYTGMWPAIAQRLELIDVPCDIFVSLNERDRDFVPRLDGKSARIHTYIVPNRGRDVLPFLMLAQKLRLAGYSYFLKLHSKKSKHRQDGSTWFDEVLASLLPDAEHIREAVSKLEDANVGLIGPRGHAVSLKRHMGSNQPLLENFLARTVGVRQTQQVFRRLDRYPFFGGTMFWGRIDAVAPLLELYLLPDDFQSEHGQIDGTAAHAIERALSVLPALQGLSLYEMSSAGIGQIGKVDPDEKYRFAP